MEFRLTTFIISLKIPARDIWIASFGGGLSKLKTKVIKDNSFEFEKYVSEKWDAK